MKRFSGFNGNALRVWGLMGLLALGVFFLTRLVLLAHAVVFSEQPASGLLGAVALGLLRDLPAVAPDEVELASAVVVIKNVKRRLPLQIQNRNFRR